MIWEISIHVLGNLIVESHGAMGFFNIAPIIRGRGVSSRSDLEGIWLEARPRCGNWHDVTPKNPHFPNLASRTLATSEVTDGVPLYKCFIKERFCRGKWGDQGPSISLHWQDEVIQWHDGSSTPIGPHLTITFEGKDDVFVGIRRSWGVAIRSKIMVYDQWDLLNGSIYMGISLMDVDHIMGIQHGHIIGIQSVYYS